ncbi:flagellar filament capping protein FliD [Pseudomonas sp. gcc21]|uniref:flagellar filament capping protein FliD n=1 Tax=Pseudomonas sp. gcc21 TaxID=2726989 RepID=UPI00145176DD|nr:flagellar filament capping protein FliD [Pseudomonas sp. gcc21]QJD58844.1 flagellar filament capping protein FliD [Pseudomonas sp. gcc21]
MAIMGLGSGMDIRGMVDALVNAEAAPKNAQLNRLEKATTAKFSGLGQFRNALSEFQTVLKDLNSPALFEKRSASSGKADVFSVAATSKASAGNYSVQVLNLAQTSKVALSQVPNVTDAIGTGKLTVTAGDKSLTVDVTDANNSLTGIRDAINAAGKESGLSATVINDPNGGGGARLILSSSDSGTGKDISVTVDTTGEVNSDLSVLAFSPTVPADFKLPEVDPESTGARVISYARDANLAIDGIPISSETNTVEGALDGVILTLKSAQSAEDIEKGNTVNLNVSEDRAGIKTQVKKFVDAYNKMMETVGSLTKVTPVGGDDGEPLAAALVGDASVRSFTSAIRGELGSVIGDTGGLRVLADLGISTQRDGSLKLDDTKFDAALKDNFDSMAGFLTGRDGLMAKLESRVAPYTANGGLLESRTTSLQNTLASVDDQRLALTRRVEKLESRLLAQFNAMDSMIGQLAGTSEYLTGVLDSLPGVVKKDN